MTDLVTELARLDDAELHEVVREARAERRRLIQTALRNIRASMLSGVSTRQAARAIHDAARGRRTYSDATTRRAIEQRLHAELDYLGDIPGEARIRQLIGNQ